MKRLFSVLFVVCVVCIFPKLSFAPEEGTYQCMAFCAVCDNCGYDACMTHLRGVASCNNDFDECFMVGIDDSSAPGYEYGDITSEDITYVCNPPSGGNTPSTSTTCTVRFCPNDDICPSNFIVGFGSSSHTSGNSLDTPSYTEFKELGGSIQPNKFLKGWSRGIGEDANNILDPGTEVTILCNNNEDVYYYSSWGVCDSGTYASQGSCESCEKGSYCTGGVKTACPAGTYGSTTNLTTSACSGPCEAGYYCPAGSPSPRQHSCPDFSSSAAEAKSINDCKCKAGYGGVAAEYSCTICLPGHSKGVGNGSCQECGDNEYQNLPGQADCKSCSATGYFTSGCQESGKGCTACESCTAGYQCAAGQKTKCTGYTYSKEGELNCSSVSTGYYAKGCDNLGHGCTDQAQCGLGSYCKDGKNITVDSGKYARGCWTNQSYDCADNGGNCNGCTWQEICPPGYYCTGGKKFKVQNGYYATGCKEGGHIDGICVGENCKGCTGETQCLAGSYCANGVKKACPAGTYGSSAGLKTSACSGPCKAGYYCPEGSTSEKQNSCPSGSSSAAGSDAVADCSCKAGFGGDASDGAACSECAAGYFKASAGNVPCSPCGTGKYQGDTGQTKCEDCNGEGEYTTNCAVTDDYKGCETCETCPAGYMCETGLKYECTSYKYSEAGMLDCRIVSAGYYADDCETGGKLCKKQVQCDTGSYCKDSKKIPVSAGHYATGCGTNHTSDCVGEDAICKGCTGQEICPPGYYCTGGKKIAVLSGRYATQCSGTTVDSSQNCIGNDCQGCKWYKTCPAINGKIGYYCTSGQKNVCRAEYYLDKEEGATSCTKCPQGTTFAGSVVVGVENCGLQTCLDYYNEAKEGTGVWEEWYDNWSQCSSDGPLAGCYMAPTKKNESEESMEVDGKGTNPKCCDTGKFGQCYYKSNKKSCIADCTGCKTAEGAVCAEGELPDKSHTCPGDQTINPPSDCNPTVTCTCPHNPNLDLCSIYLNNATNGGDVCYRDDGDESGRSDYCKDVCYKECDDSPCTTQCPDILKEYDDSVFDCKDADEKYDGRQFKNDQSCQYYDNGVPGTAPDCSVTITCRENYHKPRITGCTPCLEGYHTKDDNKEENCTPNVYKVTLNRGDQITNGTSEFFYQYMTNDNCYYYSKYTNGTESKYYYTPGTESKYYTGGTLSDCLVGAKVNTPTRTGYTFAGYYTAANGEGTQYVDKDGIIKKPIYTELGNKTLYAKWTPNVYEVTLDRAGGTNGTSNYFYQYETKGRCYYYTSDDLSTCIGGTGGVQIVKPEREGYTFDGYYTAENGGGTQYVDKDGTTIGSIYKTIGDKTLYAKWTANVFTVKFNKNGATEGAADPESKPCTYDQACTAATQNTMRKTNHVFKWWNTKNDGTGTSYDASGDITNIISQGEITLYAIWKECDACVASTGSKCELIVDANTCTYKSNCIDGYTVVEGTKDTNKPECTANEYSAIYFCGEGGGTPDPESDPVRFNDPYTVDISHRECSKPGSLFLGWEGKNNEDTIFAPYNVETEFTWAEVGDITFTAKWDACPKGYYCKNGIVEKNACPVGSTTDEGAIEIKQCYLAGGKSKICSKIGNEEAKCFLLPQGVNVTYSGSWRPSAE